MAPDSEETRIIEYPTSGIVVTWEPGRCQHAAECVGGLPQVFDPQKRPWIATDEAGVEELVMVIDRCPSFALGYHTDDGRHRAAPASS